MNAPTPDTGTELNAKMIEPGRALFPPTKPCMAVSQLPFDKNPQPALYAYSPVFGVPLSVTSSPTSAPTWIGPTAFVTGLATNCEKSITDAPVRLLDVIGLACAMPARPSNKTE